MSHELVLVMFQRLERAMNRRSLSKRLTLKFAISNRASRMHIRHQVVCLAVLIGVAITSSNALAQQPCNTQQTCQQIAICCLCNCHESGPAITISPLVQIGDSPDVYTGQSVHFQQLDVYDLDTCACEDICAHDCIADRRIEIQIDGESFSNVIQHVCGWPGAPNCQPGGHDYFTPSVSTPVSGTYIVTISFYDYWQDFDGYSNPNHAPAACPDGPAIATITCSASTPEIELAGPIPVTWPGGDCLPIITNYLPPPPNGPDPYWFLIPPVPGIQIDPDTGEITTGGGIGGPFGGGPSFPLPEEVTIGATIGLPNDTNGGTTTITYPVPLGPDGCSGGSGGGGDGGGGGGDDGGGDDGSDCSGSDCTDEAGGGKADPSKLSVTFSMGKTNSGAVSGRLRIYSEGITREAANPRNLRLWASEQDATKIFDDFGRLRQVLTEQSLADIDWDMRPPSEVTDDAIEGYKVSFYKPDQIGSQGQGGLYDQSEKTPFAVWGVRYHHYLASAQSDDQLVIKETISGTREYRYFAVAGTSALGLWSNLYGELAVGAGEFSYGTTWSHQASYRMTTEEEIDPDELSTITSWAFTEGKYTESEIGAGDEWVTESSIVSAQTPSTRAYFYAPGAGAGKAGQVRLQHDLTSGDWIWFDYDSQGRVVTQISPWADEAPPISPASPPNSSLGKKTAFGYTGNDRRPTVVQEFINDTPVKKTFFEWELDGGYAIETVERCKSSSGAQDDPGNLKTITTYEVEGENDRKLVRIQYPDQRLDLYGYDTGVYTDSGTPDEAAFDSNEPGPDRRTTIKHVLVSSETGVPFRSTMETTIRDSFGRIRMTETHVCVAADEFERTEWTVHRYDGDTGKRRFSYGSDNTVIENEWNCCKIEATIDASGIRRTFQYDGDRITQETKVGVSSYATYPAQPNTTTSFSYDADGRLNGTTVSGMQGENPPVTISNSRTYYPDGRLESTTNEADITTEFNYVGTGGYGGLLTMIEHPGNYVEYRDVYRDGRPASVSYLYTEPNMETVYQYGVDVSTGYLYTVVRPGGESSLRWTKTYTDALGRKVKDERPGYLEGYVSRDYFYNNLGQLERIESSTFTPAKGGGFDVSSAGADVLYEYDSYGSLYRTGQDINDNGTLDPGSEDRITETETIYEKDTNGTWFETTISRVYDKSGTSASTPTTASTEKRQISALAAGVIARSESTDVFGNTSVRTTTVDREHAVVTSTEDTPYSTQDIVSATYNGLLQTTTDQTGRTDRFSYDAIGRRISTQNPVSGTVTTHYNNKNQVESVESQRQNDSTTYEYDPATGRLTTVTNPFSKKTYYAYSPRGSLLKVWGDVPQPVSFSYNEFGERTSLKTYRNWSSDPEWEEPDWGDDEWPQDPGEADTTTWAYDPTTGVLLSKTYADSTTTTYDYYLGGATKTRIWARSGSIGITNYSYNDLTGELLNIDYADNSIQSDISFTYDRLGRRKTVDDALGQREFEYNAFLQLETEDIDGSLFEKRITYSSAPIEDSGNYLWSRGVAVGIGSSPDDYEASLKTDGLGRPAILHGPGLPATGAVYQYHSFFGLIERLDAEYDEESIASVVRHYSGPPADLYQIENIWAEFPISTYDYRFDRMGRRTSIVRSEGVYGSGHHVKYEYNDRNELASAMGFLGADIEANPPQYDTTRDHNYTFDPIGNRRSYLPPGGADPFDLVGYATNAVNQYTATANPAEAFDYDADGNLTQDDGYDYSWDSENRLVSVTAREPQAGSKKLVFAYDYLGRRVRKQVFDWDPTANGNEGAWETSPTTDLRFIYDGWNLLMELDGLNSNAVLRKYTWGLDLSSTPQGAGGVGGLVSALDTNGTPGTTADDKQYFYYCDAMGNVGQVIDATSGPLAAQYDYTDSFGGAAAGGAWAAKNPFRFSTKYFDGEIDYADTDNDGLYYYGHRYYSPRLGRWMSRDPLEESGGTNVLAFTQNMPTNGIDPLGLRPDVATNCCCCCVVHLRLIDLQEIGKDIEPGSRFGYRGHQFTGEVLLLWKKANKSKGEKPGDCSFEWWEYSDRPAEGDGDFGQPVNEWWAAHRDSRARRESPVFEAWRNRNRKVIQCPRYETLQATDDPKWDVNRVGRRSLFIFVRVKSAPNCGCKSSEAILRLTQILDAGGGGPGQAEFHEGRDFPDGDPIE